MFTSHCLSTFEPALTTVPSWTVTSLTKFKLLVHGPAVAVAVGAMDTGDGTDVVVGSCNVGMGCVGGTNAVDVADGAQAVIKKIATENTESTEFFL